VEAALTGAPLAPRAEAEQGARARHQHAPVGLGPGGVGPEEIGMLDASAQAARVQPGQGGALSIEQPDPFRLLQRGEHET
jgi:hypothetical protein